MPSRSFSSQLFAIAYEHERCGAIKTWRRRVANFNMPPNASGASGPPGVDILQLEADPLATQPLWCETVPGGDGVYSRSVSAGTEDAHQATALTQARGQAGEELLDEAHPRAAAERLLGLIARFAFEPRRIAEHEVEALVRREGCEAIAGPQAQRHPGAGGVVACGDQGAWVEVASRDGGAAASGSDSESTRSGAEVEHGVTAQILPGDPVAEHAGREEEAGVKDRRRRPQLQPSDDAAPRPRQEKPGATL